MTERPSRRGPFRRKRTREVPTASDRRRAAVLNAIAWLVGRIDLDRASAMMGWLWRRLAPFNIRHRRADRQLAMALPELTAAERRRILGHMWENLGRTALETLRLPEMIADRSRFDLHLLGAETDWDEIRKGAIFVSLHQGNWEFAAWGIRLAGISVAAVYRPLKNPIAERFLHHRRAPIYDAGLFPSDATSALKLRTLARRGVSIGMLGDLRDSTGIEIPFFRHPALVSTFPAVLARRLGLPLVIGRALRTRGARFRIEALKVDCPRSDDVETDIKMATLAINKQYEIWIRQHPEQWMWAHRKWRGREGSKDGLPEATAEKSGIDQIKPSDRTCS